MKVPREPAHEVEREPAPAAAPRQAAADRVLALQSTAGNRAVAAMLAREPDAPVQADTKGPPKDKAPEAPSGPHITLGELGTIAIDSASVSTTGPPGGSGGSGRGRGDDRPKEIVITSRVGKHSALLQKALTDGKPMDGEIVISGVRIIVKGAMITSYQASDPSGEKDKPLMETWTINPTSIEYVLQQKDDKDGARKPEQDGWDLAVGKGA
jgi:hypothetical protein